MEYIKTLSEIDKEDLELAGGKGANLGEMVKVGIPVPEGFVIETKAYFDYISENKLIGKIEKILKNNIDNPERLMEASKAISHEFGRGIISENLSRQILSAYSKLGSSRVAVRSSTIAGDSPETSFAGQLRTFLNVKGEKQLLKKVIECWASLFTPRAIFYRILNNIDYLKTGLAVVVQEMVEPEISGVMFTVDPVTNNKSLIVIEAAFGLGELVVGGKVIPDQYQVRKSDFKILSQRISHQSFQQVALGDKIRQIPVSPKFAKMQKLSNSEIVQLAKLGVRLENHYYFPQDIEWAKAREKIYILQTRPVTTFQVSTAAPARRHQTSSIRADISNLPLILEGIGASPGIASGVARILKSVKEIGKLKKGEVFVTVMTNPDFVPAMKRAVGVVTDKGGRTSHAAIVSRELGIPAVVGTKTATNTLKEGQVITVNGTIGKVYSGSPKINGKIITWQPKQPEVRQDFKTVTKIYVNLAEPEKAESVAKLNVDGVGLLRAEFMIAQMGVHPKKVIASGKTVDYIKKLADNLKIFAKFFNPRPVIYRASDFKTNEYRNLQGGQSFEPHEANPIIGFRGAARYLAQPEIFQMELAAVKKVFQSGFDNLKLMVPYVRTPQELAKVKEIVALAGLTKLSGFEFWMMVEIPSNVLILPKFLEVGVDGVSIGSNDLTMLILGVDRDNEQLATEFSEMDEAVLKAVKNTIEICRDFSVPCSICGQAPSNFDDLVKKLVSWGINSISVSPDCVDRLRELVADTERELVLNGKDASYGRQILNIK